MNFRKYTIIVVVTILTACSFSGADYNGPDIKLKRRISDGRILVSDFSTEGKNIPDVSPEILSQRLYDLLYINTNLHVINRQSLTDSIEVKYEMTGSLIHSTSGLNFDAEAPQKLIMTLRIADLNTNEVVGIISASCRFTSGLKQRVDDLLENCVDELKDIR